MAKKNWDEYTHLPNHDAMLDQWRQLDELLEQGRLTEAELEARFDMYYDNRDYIPDNVGAGWIWRLFKGSNSAPEGWDAQIDIEALLRRHFDTPHVVELLLVMIDRVMGNVEWITGFVRDAYIHCGARNNGWIPAAIRGGMPREDIAAAIKQRLLNKTESQPGMADCIYDFLRFGAGISHEVRYGRFDPETPWGVFNDSELERVLTHCARLRPREAASMMTVIRARLGDQRADRFFFETVKYASSIAGFSLKDLRQLPLVSRKVLCAKFHADFNTGWDTVRFITDTAMAIGGELGGHFFGRTMERALYLEDEERPTISPPTVYRACRSLLHGHDDAELKDVVQAWCELILTRHDYVVGLIEEGRRRDRLTGREMRQMQVSLDRHIYVQERSQHRYFPKVDDVVIFQTQGHQLTPQVTAVRFIPAASKGDHPNEASY